MCVSKMNSDIQRIFDRVCDIAYKTGPDVWNYLSAGLTYQFNHFSTLVAIFSFLGNNACVRPAWKCVNSIWAILKPSSCWIRNEIIETATTSVQMLRQLLYINPIATGANVFENWELFYALFAGKLSLSSLLLSQISSITISTQSIQLIEYIMIFLTSRYFDCLQFILLPFFFKNVLYK